MDVKLNQRFWEVDLLRGLAVTMMILFHLVFDLGYFGIYSLDVYSGFWFYFAHLTAAVFILVVGISLVLSYSKAKLRGRENKLYLKFLKRGIKIFSLGLGLTLVTYLLVREDFIIFGVLHLIGVSIMLIYPFLRLRALTIFPGLAFVFIGLYLQSITFNFSWLVWLGLAPDNFYTLDYFPIFPWFGVVLIGVFLGYVLYGGYRRRIDLPELSNSYFVRPLAFLGRHSLLVYLIHQPLLIGTLILMGKFVTWN